MVFHSLNRRLRILELSALVALGLMAWAYLHWSGRLSQQMLTHIGVMSVLAPGCAYWFARKPPLSARLESVLGTAGLWSATLLQLGIFLLWHLPSFMTWSMRSGMHGALMHASLFFAAIWFWLCVFNLSRVSPWHCVFSLLLTGKIFCLTALLLVFSPRLIYLHNHMHGALTLFDQQLAGSIMVVVCPLTYVAAAVVILIRWFKVANRYATPTIENLA